MCKTLHCKSQLVAASYTAAIVLLYSRVQLTNLQVIRLQLVDYRRTARNGLQFCCRATCCLRKQGIEDSTTCNLSDCQQEQLPARAARSKSHCHQERLPTRATTKNDYHQLIRKSAGMLNCSVNSSSRSLSPPHAMASNALASLPLSSDAETRTICWTICLPISRNI